MKAQGGDPAAIEDLSKLPTAKHQVDVLAPEDGFVAGIDSEAIGLAAMALGAGREKVDSVIDPAVGFVLLRKVGDRVKRGDALVKVHHNGSPALEDVKRRVLAAYRFAGTAPAPRPLVLERLE